MSFTNEELIEAKRQIVSTVSKLKKVVNTMESKENKDRLKPQITLAKRRVRAFEIALSLIEKEIDKNL